MSSTPTSPFTPSLPPTHPPPLPPLLNQTGCHRQTNLDASPVGVVEEDLEVLLQVPAVLRDLLLQQLKEVVEGNLAEKGVPHLWSEREGEGRGGKREKREGERKINVS